MEGKVNSEQSERVKKDQGQGPSHESSQAGDERVSLYDRRHDSRANEAGSRHLRGKSHHLIEFLGPSQQQGQTIDPEGYAGARS